MKCVSISERNLLSDALLESLILNLYIFLKFDVIDWHLIISGCFGVLDCTRTG